jgi:GTP-binding protein YchF
MNIEIGIIGLPQSGKTSLFSALTGGKLDASHNTEGGRAHVGVAKVPEPRLQTLADLLHPSKVIPVEMSYVDVGASVKGMSREHGIGGELLNRLSTVDALINVARAFESESVPHPEGSVDAERDIATMELELAFSDLAIIERRLERIQTQLKAAKPAERQAFVHEQEALLKFKDVLEKETPVRDLPLNQSEERLLANYQFLTAKPLLLAVNIGESQLAEREAMESALNARYSSVKRHVIALCVELEMELAQLEDTARDEFRADFGIEEPASERVIRASYGLLGLVTFFTIAHDEMRAWSVPSGTSAPRAAGKVHSDMERGFIRAEVVRYEDLLQCGSIAEARKRGVLRLEGKDYTVQDGDVITFLFNI